MLKLSKKGSIKVAENEMMKENLQNAQKRKNVVVHKRKMLISELCIFLLLAFFVLKTKREYHTQNDECNILFIIVLNFVLIISFS